MAVDYLYIGEKKINFEIPGTLRLLSKNTIKINDNRCIPIFSSNQIDEINPKEVTFLEILPDDNLFDKIKKLPKCVLILSSNSTQRLPIQRQFFIECMKRKIDNPVIIKRNYEGYNKEEFLLYSSTDIGGLQIDGFGDGVWLQSENNVSFINDISFGILQASRTRISKTEYISCPSCGRTLFDLQETTARIRSRTSHLKGLKIGIMGCVVNGPGEMADADYGYVGTAPGKISLYKGQEVVEKHIRSEKAVDALIKLIQVNGDWIDP